VNGIYSNLPKNLIDDVEKVNNEDCNVFSEGVNPESCSFKFFNSKSLFIFDYDVSTI
jgi:hypothetical protein